MNEFRFSQQKKNRLIIEMSILIFEQVRAVNARVMP